MDTCMGWTSMLTETTVCGVAVCYIAVSEWRWGGPSLMVPIKTGPQKQKVKPSRSSGPLCACADGGLEC